MKIIQLIQKPQLRGAEIFACQLSKTLNERGHDCIIVTLFSGEATLPFEGEIFHLRLSKKRRFVDWGGWKKLANIIAKEKPDILQANAGDTLKYAIISKLLFGWRTPVIFRNASTVSLYIKNSLVRRWNDFLFTKTAHIISVSEFTKKDFLKTFSTFSQRISVIPIGINPNNFRGDEIRNEHPPVLLHVGGFTFEKNHIGLMRIMQSIIACRSDVVLWLVGDGPLRVKVENFVKANGLDKKVEFFGYQAHPQPFFQRASLFLLPSIIEGLPGVILESFYFRLPVISYNAGAIGELVKPGVTGFLVEKGDEKCFASTVIAALDDPLRFTYADNAFRTF
jgi:glycosyltransferase involved in cell wall biosynthesis